MPLIIFFIRTIKAIKIVITPIIYRISWQTIINNLDIKKCKTFSIFLSCSSENEMLILGYSFN